MNSGPGCTPASGRRGSNGRCEAFTQYTVYVLRCRVLVFKERDDHILNLVDAEFSRRVIHVANTDARFSHMLHVTGMGNTHTTPYWMLKRIAQTGREGAFGPTIQERIGAVGHRHRQINTVPTPTVAWTRP